MRDKDREHSERFFQPTDDEIHRYFLKIILYGEHWVGKSHLLLRYTNNPLPRAPTSTSVDFKVKNITIMENEIVHLQIWDMTGGRDHCPLVSGGSDIEGVVLVYDITRRATFELMGEYVEYVKRRSAWDAKILLLGNKCDLEGSRAVSVEEGQAFASQYNLQFMEVSALNNINLDEAFMNFATSIIYPPREDNDFLLSNIEEPQSNKNCCKIC